MASFLRASPPDPLAAAARRLGEQRIDLLIVPGRHCPFAQVAAPGRLIDRLDLEDRGTARHRINRAEKQVRALMTVVLDEPGL